MLFITIVIIEHIQTYKAFPEEQTLAPAVCSLQRIRCDSHYPLQDLVFVARYFDYILYFPRHHHYGNYYRC